MDDIIQGSDEWFRIRCGKVTASRIADVVAKTKSGPSASRANYAAELIAERLTGVPAERFSSTAMQWGTDQEPNARMAYEFLHGVDVMQIGFVLHPIIGDSGASPDGLIGDNGLVEFKCPNTATHIETLTRGEVPGKYLPQMFWQMACTDRAWCDFVSYDPRMPEPMQLFVKRLHRDEQIVKELEAEVVGFLNDVRAKVEQLQRIYDPQSEDEQSTLLMAGE